VYVCVGKRGGGPLNVTEKVLEICLNDLPSKYNR
jgi:hypothetical protein